jgi:hypothetical protein
MENEPNSIRGELGPRQEIITRKFVEWICVMANQAVDSKPSSTGVP